MREVCYDKYDKCVGRNGVLRFFILSLFFICLGCRGVAFAKELRWPLFSNSTTIVQEGDVAQITAPWYIVENTYQDGDYDFATNKNLFITPVLLAHNIYSAGVYNIDMSAYAGEPARGVDTSSCRSFNCMSDRWKTVKGSSGTFVFTVNSLFYRPFAMCFSGRMNAEVEWGQTLAAGDTSPTFYYCSLLGDGSGVVKPPIENKDWCAVISSSLEFDFGVLQSEKVNNESMTKSLDIYCTNRREFFLRLNSNKSSSSVPLDNGLKANLTVNGNSISSSQALTGPTGNSSVQVKVTLSGEPREAGPFKGVDALIIENP